MPAINLGSSSNPASALQLAQIREALGILGVGFWYTGSFAGLQTATATDLALGSPTLNVGYNEALVTDLGEPTIVRWVNGNWLLPRGFDLVRLAAETVLVAGTAAQLVMPAKLIPAKLLATGARLEMLDAIAKSASGTETMTLTVRMGATGLVGDQAIYSMVTTGSAQAVAMHHLKVLNRTQVVHTTPGALDAIAVQTTPTLYSFGSTSTTVPTAITVGNFDADMYLSYWLTMSASTQIPRVLEARARVS